MIRSVAAVALFLLASISGAAAACGPPVPLVNGTNADATQVNTNLTNVFDCVRDKLSTNRTYYVRTDGNDACNGLTNAAGSSGACAFLTIQKAINVVSPVDIAGFAVTIQVGNGTYTGGATVSTPFFGGPVTLLGDPTTPSNVLLNVTGITVSNGAALRVSGFKLVSAGTAMLATSKGSISVVGKMDFGSAVTTHMSANVGGSIAVSASYNITGGAPGGHMRTQSLGYIANSGNTVTITGTPAFASGFAITSTAGIVDSVNSTWSGAVGTGLRYQADTGGGISTGGSGLTYFPGSSSGIATAPGWYS